MRPVVGVGGFAISRSCALDRFRADSLWLKGLRRESGRPAQTDDAADLQLRWRSATVAGDAPLPDQRYRPCAEPSLMEMPATSWVVLASLIAITITPGAPPLSPPAPGVGSCPPGPSVALRGVQRAPYDRAHLAVGFNDAATTAQFVLPVTSHIVVHIAGGAGICWSGGEALGAFSPAASWNTIHRSEERRVGK